jgi:hypothetical protein
MRPGEQTVPGRDAAIRLAFVALAAVLVGTRFAGYDQSLWHDEIYTIQHYVVPGPVGSFGHYGTNDHILFSLVTWLTVRLPGFGGSAYRLWSILPFIAAVAVTTLWLRRRAGDAVALLFGALATASPLLLDLSTAARGYGLAFLAMSMMTIAGYEAAVAGSVTWLSIFGVSGVIGCWTLPTFVLPFAGVSVAVLMRRSLRRAVIARLVPAAVAVGGFYALPIHALIASRGQQYGAPLPWHAPVTGAFWEFAGAFVGMDAPGVAAHLMLIFGVAPLLVVGWFAARRRMPTFGAVSIWPVAATFFVLTPARFHVEVRFASFLLVPLFICAAFGLEALASRPDRTMWPLFAIYSGVVASTIAAIFFVVAKRDLTLPVEANREAAHAVAEDLSKSNGRLVIDTFHPSNLFYYLPAQKPPSMLSARRLDQMLCSPRRGSFVLVQEPFGDVEPVNTACLAREGATVQVFGQRDFGERISVWLVPAGLALQQSRAARATNPLIVAGST